MRSRCRGVPPIGNDGLVMGVAGARLASVSECAARAALLGLGLVAVCRELTTAEMRPNCHGRSMVRDRGSQPHDLRSFLRRQ